MTGENVSLQQKDAEQLARLFNVLFNSAMLYGGTHQTTLKSVHPFFDLLTKLLDRTDMISLVIDRESLFFEEWQLEKVINTRRILQQFGKTGIVSITFEHGVSMQEVEILIRYAGDSNVITPVNEISSKLLEGGSTSIKLNYIRYGRITNDQTVIGKDDAATVSGSGGTGTGQALSSQSLGHLEEILSLARLFENPGSSAAAFSQSALDPSTTDSAVKSLAELRESINTADAPSMELLLNAVYELKVDLADAIAVQKETGRLLTKTAPINTEMDALTCDVIVKLVKEEFGSGDISIRRLAQIILRMLPDTGELKRLLPQLKPALIEAGMTLSQYLELIRSLNVEFESESLAGTLSQAASGIGATVSELVSAIQSQPDEAARLLVMASEIGKGVSDDDNQLSAMLTEYIEKVSTGIALQSEDLSKDDGKAKLRHMLEQLESGLLDELKKYGVQDVVLSKVSTLLSERRDSTFDRATEQWITSELSSGAHLSPQEISEQLIRMINGQSQLDRLHKPLTEAFATRGFDREQTEAIFERLAHRITAGKMMKLPPGALAPNNMTFLLDREIKCRFRYHSNFATIIITAEGLRHKQGVRRLSDDEASLVTTKIYSIIKSEVRDIDLVGNVGGTFEKAVFIIMTMTDENGAQAALQRLQHKINEFSIPLKTDTATIITAASVTVPKPETDYDLRAFLEHCHNRHQRAVIQCIEHSKL